MSGRFYKSEIINRERLEALNGAPFWYVRWATYFHDEERLTDYIIEHIFGYDAKDYPVLSIYPRHYPKHDRRITLALCRQDNPWSHNEQNFALGSLEDLKHLCMRLRLTGHKLRIQPPIMKTRNFINVLVESEPFDPKLLEKLSRWKYNVET